MNTVWKRYVWKRKLVFFRKDRAWAPKITGPVNRA